MTEALFFDTLREALRVALVLAAPLLAVALAAGLTVGLFQALTSVQEMTLTFVPKIGLMLAVFWVSMSFMSDSLTAFFRDRLLALIAGV
ncbi:flagellar biosynthetic protein FliQ [Frigidibacter oleivorans]|uniref:flagellar biosynthetic protein FliQ n=1 Tax=Frigidibacter oleivorans TaxID=2487129 RepID=UPI000F8E19E9|nr:flagellar biosynthetic protein FliQ [Frigidibacter oleivorans]